MRDGLVIFGRVTSTCGLVLGLGWTCMIYDIWHVASLLMQLFSNFRSLRTLEQLRRVAQLAEGAAGPVCSVLRCVECNRRPTWQVLSGQVMPSK